MTPPYLSQVIEDLGDWRRVISNAKLCSTLKEVLSEYKCGTCYPKKEDIFQAFKLCPYNKCKVIMIGQDPYPQPNVATGLAFANKKEVENLSPSLLVLKESLINEEVPHNRIIFDQTLESWATQGVLLLNSSLSVRKELPGSHILIWRSFIKDFLRQLSMSNPGLIYVLMGRVAKSFKGYINPINNMIIECNHPSYYARTETKFPREVFDNINDLIDLMNGNDERIEWYRESE